MTWHEKLQLMKMLVAKLNVKLNSKFYQAWLKLSWAWEKS